MSMGCHSAIQGGLHKNYVVVLQGNSIPVLLFCKQQVKQIAEQICPRLILWNLISLYSSLYFSVRQVQYNAKGCAISTIQNQLYITLLRCNVIPVLKLNNAIFCYTWFLIQNQSIYIIIIVYRTLDLLWRRQELNHCINLLLAIFYTFRIIWSILKSCIGQQILF